MDDRLKQYETLFAAMLLVCGPPSPKETWARNISGAVSRNSAWFNECKQYLEDHAPIKYDYMANRPGRKTGINVTMFHDWFIQSQQESSNEDTSNTHKTIG